MSRLHAMPQLVVFAGLPGTGKSTLAERIAADIGAPAFSGDWLMGALQPYGVLTGLDRSAYSDMYYTLLQTLMRRQLMLKQSAVMDCLIDDAVAVRWRQTAQQYGARLRIVECICTDESEHQRRVETRRRDIPGWHEIGWDHVQRMKAQYSPLAVPRLTVDAMQPLDQNLRQVHQYISPPT